MSAGIVEIPGDGDAGGDPFIVGDELTIYEAAMVYSGRPPDNPFFEGASLRELEVVLGRGVLLRRNFDERPYKISWAVHRELCERVGRREIKPVRTAYLSNDELDPRYTVIRTVDLAKLAEERGDAIFDFSPWTPAPTSAAPPPRTESARPRPKRDQARALIEAACPGGPPANMPPGELMRLCDPGGRIDRRTFRRARDDLLAEKDLRAGA